MDLEGKVALVTGASGDIGGTIARDLAKQGANLVVCYLGNTLGAQAVLQDVQSVGSQAIALQLDQRNPDSIDQVVAQVVARYGQLNILVNNAAWNIGVPLPQLEDLTVDLWDRVLETNLRGPFLLARACAGLLRAGHGGHIVNIASAGGIAPESSSIAYSSSKAGLIHLTRCLAVAFAPLVSVNCLAPGLVEGTRMANRMPPEVVEKVRRQAVLGQVGDADDIARQVIAFCKSTSMTGQVVVVDGGMPVAMR